MKLPHWLQLALALAVLVVTWILAKTATGDIMLPATAIAVLTVVKTVLGLFSDSVSKTPPSKGGPGPGSVLGTLALLAAVPGCQLNPAVVTDVTAGLKLAACMWGVYSRDESPQPPAPWVVVAVDMGGTCGADVGDIVNLFGATSPVGQAAIGNASQVHAAAIAQRGKASP